MRVVLIADTFPPLRNSGAVQLRDLSREFVRQGHSLAVVLPSADITASWQLETSEGYQILRLRAPKTKDIGYIRRTLGELFMPFFMRRHFQKSPLAHECWDGVVWYAPSIFHGPFANFLKQRSRCKGYLIIRDIFPEWAVDMGLMRKGLPYYFFDRIAKYQYSVADVIGVQTPGNSAYFEKWLATSGRKLEVLQNWLDQPSQLGCSLRVNGTALAGRKIFVYAGNMGVAQGMDIILALAEKFLHRPDVGFLFVGRGSEVVRLKSMAQERLLSNVLFFDEIQPDEIPDLYSQCSVGIVALDPRHKTHNIPGKFLTYMQSGLPVLANINAGNDLSTMIRSEAVGQVCESNRIDDLFFLAKKILEQLEHDAGVKTRCHQIFRREFSVDKAVSKIVDALKG